MIPSLYVHVPYCLSKCRYCALYSDAMPPPEDFAALLSREYALRCGENRFDTLYLGGGTPALLGAGGISELARGLERAGASFSPDAEIAIEINPSPGVLEDGLLPRLRELGFNRVSFGAQSLDEGVLKRMGRRHGKDDVARAAEMAQRAGFSNISIDLIAGYPGVSQEIWRETLREAAQLPIKHISVYSLIVEEGTPLEMDVREGRVLLQDDDALMESVSFASSFLRSKGFFRYEISNYAMEGFEARHNLKCWRGEDYLGLGPGASSRTGLARRTNAKDSGAWRTSVGRGELPEAICEELSPIDDATERFVFGLRTREGVNPGVFLRSRPGFGELGLFWRRRLEMLEKNGIAERFGSGSWRLTPRGMEVADSAMEELMP